jgi:hypothetical protein
MAISPGETASLVFKRVLRGESSSYSFDSRMLKVFMELDGKKSVREVAKISGLNMATMRDILNRFLKLDLVELVENGIPVLDQNFFDFLTAQLSRAIGPIAGVFIEDAVIDLGHRFSRFPRHQAAELIDLLSRKIQKEDKRTVFKQNMVRKLNEVL